MLKILYTDSDKSGTNKNFFYLLGFQPSLGIIAFSKSKIYIFLDGRYLEKQKQVNINNLKEKLNNTNLEVEFVKLEKDYKNSLEKIIKKHKKIYLEKTTPYFFYEIIKDIAKKSEIKFRENFFEKQRIIKSKDEIKKIKKAISIIENVYREIEKLNETNKLRGKTELEIRSFIIQKIFEFGGEGESFESIVAFGVNSAIPHHTTGNTKIGNGVLLIDMGALYGGYASDFTRTFWVGEKTKDYKEFEKVHQIVAKAQKEAKLIVKSGIKASLIDKKARDTITLAGYGEYFTHSTGHGIGLDVHELPRVNTSYNKQIKSNMVFTIEPGIYLPGNFGVRIEDIVICK